MNYQNNKVGHTNVTTLGKLCGPLVTQGKRTLKNLGTQINWDEGDINFIALLTQKVPNTRGNILCSLKTLSGYEKPLEPSYFLCHVRAEQQWKGQQWCLIVWMQSWRGSRQHQNLEGSERGLPWHSQAPHPSELVWSPCWTRVKHRTDPKCTKRADLLREEMEHIIKVNYIINTVEKINSIFHFSLQQY